MFVETHVAVAERQRAFFRTGATRPYRFRLERLRALKAALLAHEREIYDALAADLGKAPAESYLTELFVTINEINYAMRRLRRWMRPRRAPTGLVQQIARSRRLPEPYGVALIIAPWNYPFQLTLVPLVGAIAAGNCAVVKPSELAPASSAVLRALVASAFERDHVTVVEGGPEVGAELLSQPFDYIFFTGGTRLGRIVARAAAERLTPVTLELGGKSPCIVDASANLENAARRIAWARFLNAGQTCTAPDYLLVHRSVKERLLSLIVEALRSFYGEHPAAGADLSRIINRSHYDRLVSLLRGEKILYGGGCDDEHLFIEPTLVDAAGFDAPIMGDEIFGPILPVVAYDDLDEAIRTVADRPAPLALYVFTRDSRTERRVVESIPAGGACINDCIYHMTTTGLPFGGVGASGTGSYHGEQSFTTFSHFKSVMKRSALFDLPLRFPPYARTTGWLRLVKRLFT